MKFVELRNRPGNMQNVLDAVPAGFSFSELPTLGDGSYAQRPIVPPAVQRANSRDMASRARRLAQGLADAHRDSLLHYAEELEGEAAEIEARATSLSRPTGSPNFPAALSRDRSTA